MTKSKRSLFNSICAVILNLGNGLLTFVVTYLVINKFGSDFNGINSTANQIVNMLLIVEGGFTVATNVALFKPYQSNDMETFNSIVSATRVKFKKIGLLFLFLGVLISYIYSFFVTSELDQPIINTIFIMAIFPSGINLYFATKYRILIQAEQKEYIISIISMITVFGSHISNIIFLSLFDTNMLVIRLNTMIFSLTQAFLFYLYCKNKFANVDFYMKPNFELIKGTKDIIFQKITNVIYSTLPILAISILPNSGAMMVSVYAVYNNVFLLIKSVLQAFLDGPRLSLGQLISEGDKTNIKKQFSLYEFITIIVLSLFISTASIMIMPFVSWYTTGVTDINYVNNTIAILICIITYIEIIHIPSGNFIVMSGRFSICRRIQLIAAILLIVSTIILLPIFDFYGILISLLLTVIALAIMEIGYVHLIILDNLFNYLKIVIVNLIVILIMIFLWLFLIINVQFSFIKLFLVAIFVFLINGIVLLLCNYIFFKENVIFLFNKVIALLKK